MGIEDDEDSSAGYGYQQQNYTTAQQNYTTHQPSYTMPQQNYHHMAQQNGYDEDGYYATNDDNSYNYTGNDRRYVSHVGLNQAMPGNYHHQQQHHQMNNHRVGKPVAVYAQRPSGWGWGSTNSRQYFGNRGSRYGDSGYVHQNSSGGYQNSGGGYQSEWMYN